MHGMQSSVNPSSATFKSIMVGVHQCLLETQVTTGSMCSAGMLAEQMHDLQAAESHYEQHLALGNAQQSAEAPGPEQAAAFANVMKVSCLLPMTAPQSLTQDL